MSHEFTDKIIICINYLHIDLVDTFYVVKIQAYIILLNLGTFFNLFVNNIS